MASEHIRIAAGINRSNEGPVSRESIGKPPFRFHTDQPVLSVEDGAERRLSAFGLKVLEAETNLAVRRS